MRFAYQFSSALVGISIAGELGDRNGRRAGLVIQAQICKFLSSTSTPNLQSVSRSDIQIGFDGTRPRPTEQPSDHRRNPFLQS